MATYYVRKTGSNAAGGTTSGTAWQTIGKALTSASSGDTVYVGAGVYREAVSVSTTPASTLTLIADVDGKNTGDVGEVRWTAYTTSDTTSATLSLTLNTNGKSNITMKKFTIVGGNFQGVVGNSGFTTSQNWTFEDCTFVCQASSYSGVEVIAQNGVALNWTFDRCRFVGMTTKGSTNAAFLRFYLQGTTAVNANVVVRNCFFMGAGANAIAFEGQGSGGGYGGNTGGGGGTISYCTAVGTDAFLRTTSLNPDYPVVAYDNVMFTSSGFVASTSTEITESYNVVYSPTGYTGISIGTGDLASGYLSPLFHIGQELQHGRNLRPNMMPCPDSSIWSVGYTNTPPTVDLLNRVKPSGGGFVSTAYPCPGALERHDIAVKDTTVYDATPNSIRITGPGDHRVLLPVDAVSTTISVKVRYDSSYSGSLPQAIIRDNGEIGVTTQTVTTVAAANTWATLTFSAFTPTAKGWIELDLVSRSGTGTGNVYFDTLSVS